MEARRQCSKYRAAMSRPRPRIEVPEVVLSREDLPDWALAVELDFPGVELVAWLNTTRHLLDLADVDDAHGKLLRALADAGRASGEPLPSVARTLADLHPGFLHSSVMSWIAEALGIDSVSTFDAMFRKAPGLGKRGRRSTSSAIAFVYRQLRRCFDSANATMRYLARKGLGRETLVTALRRAGQPWQVATEHPPCRCSQTNGYPHLHCEICGVAAPLWCPLVLPRYLVTARAGWALVGLGRPFLTLPLAVTNGYATYLGDSCDADKDALFARRTPSPREARQSP